MMNRRQLRIYLGTHGFKYKRQTRHGEIWIDDDGKMLLLQGNPEKSDHRAVKNFLAEVNRIVQARKTRTIVQPVEKETEEMYTQARKEPTPLRTSIGEVVQASHKPMVQAQEIRPEENKAPQQAPVAEKNSRTRSKPKYKWVDRQRIFERLLALDKAGLDTTAITVRMQQEGFKAPDGGLFRHVYVTSALRKLTQGRAAPVTPQPEAPQAASARAPAPQPGNRLPDAVQWILLDKSLTDAQKIAMITAWAGL